MSNSHFEKDLADLREAVRRGELAKKLATNKIFKELILDEYMVKEAARYVQTSVNPNLRPEARADALAFAQSTGYLKTWLDRTITLGEQAQESLDAFSEAVARGEVSEDGRVINDEGEGY